MDGRGLKTDFGFVSGTTLPSMESEKVRRTVNLIYFQFFAKLGFFHTYSDATKNKIKTPKKTLKH